MRRTRERFELLFCLTPNLCSSSTTAKPNLYVRVNSPVRCRVTTFSAPFFKASSVAFFSFDDINLSTFSHFTPYLDYIKKVVWLVLVTKALVTFRFCLTFRFVFSGLTLVSFRPLAFLLLALFFVAYAARECSMTAFATSSLPSLSSSMV